jgi:hypothetical protein
MSPKVTNQPFVTPRPPQRSMPSSRFSNQFGARSGRGGFFPLFRGDLLPPGSPALRSQGEAG